MLIIRVYILQFMMDWGYLHLNRGNTGYLDRFKVIHIKNMVRLTKEQIQFWKVNGYIKISGIFTDQEMNIVSKEYDRIFKLKNNPGMEARWAGEEMKKAAQNKEYSVHSVHNLQFHSAIFAHLLHNNSLLEALEDIMGTPNILLHHTKAHNKPPGKGAPYLMHQDYHYFPYKKHSMVAAFLNVDPSSPENGGLCVYPGSHKLGPLEDVGVSNEKESFHFMDPKKYPIEKATPITCERGDVVVFSYLLLHGSYMNLSERSRRMFLIQLMSAEDEPVSEVHKSPGQGWVLCGSNDRRRAVMEENFLH